MRLWKAIYVENDEDASLVDETLARMREEAKDVGRVFDYDESWEQDDEDES